MIGHLRDALNGFRVELGTRCRALLDGARSRLVVLETALSRAPSVPPTSEIYGYVFVSPAGKAQILDREVGPARWTNPGSLAVHQHTLSNAAIETNWPASCAQFRRVEIGIGPPLGSAPAP